MCLPREEKPLSANAKAKAALIISRDCGCVEGCSVRSNLQVDISIPSCSLFRLVSAIIESKSECEAQGPMCLVIYEVYCVCFKGTNVKILEAGGLSE